MNITPKKIILSSLVMLVTLSTFAAPPVGPPPPTPPPPPGLPIDGSVVLLVFVAIIYGFYILKKFRLQTK